MSAIDTSVSDILSRPLPPRYDSRKNRWRSGNMGLASKLRLLQEFGYRVDVTVAPPEKESPIFKEVIKPAQ